ncbi:helix-turn-helix domain-containing protein [Streptomyces sp. NPDC101191]|uniref:helix-turn-helix domain-containing protein n=1 Tax=Streptomyces sp. NPDC101191 TaxID=3366126 RepID=UPI00380B808E
MSLIGNMLQVGYGLLMPKAPDDTAALLARRQAFGRRLKDLRVRAGLSQAQLAESADMNRVFYVGVEGGRRNVSLDKVFALADALGVDVGELFRDLNSSITDPSPGPGDETLPRQ